MSFNAEELLLRLGELESAAPATSRYVIAFSGGLDSTVLLHALSLSRDRHGKELLAVHVNHHLHADSAAWARHAEQAASGFGVVIAVESVDVDRSAGLGPEAAARDARYAALSRHVDAGDLLLSAHHRDDQAETLLINLLRGSGPAGLAGIPRLRSFGNAWLARPLLEFSHDALVQYARDNDLAWLDDPSNAESQFDRNYLRNELMPVLKARWPDADQRLARSAALAREAAELLDELADADIATMNGSAARLNVTVLAKVSPARQRNVLRRAIGRAGLPPISSAQLGSIVEQLIPAREDASPLVQWNGAEARRYRQHLYLLPALADVEFVGRSLGHESVFLGAGLGSLVLEPGTGTGLSGGCVEAGLSLRQRQGGEEIKPVGHTHTRKLKKLLHEEGVVPWMRDRLPLIYCGERLVAVADLWLDSGAAAENGAVIRWRDRPALR